MSNPQPLTKEDFIKILDEKLDDQFGKYDRKMDERFAKYDSRLAQKLDDRFRKYDQSLDQKLDDRFEAADLRTHQALMQLKEEMLEHIDGQIEEMRDEFRAVVDQNKLILQKLTTKADTSEVEELRQDVHVLEREIAK